MLQHGRLFQGAQPAVGERQSMNRGFSRLKINRCEYAVFCKEKEKQDIEDFH